MKWLQSFWNAHVDPVSAIRNVKVNVGYEPFIFIDYIVNQVQYEKCPTVFVCLKHCCDKSTTSSIRMARRKTWPEGVAERRGLGVAGKRGRKAWLKGVVLRHACRIEDVVLISVGLPEQGTDNSSGLAKECQMVSVRTVRLRVPPTLRPQ